LLEIIRENTVLNVVTVPDHLEVNLDKNITFYEKRYFGKTRRKKS
jgi:hypothetical protein